MTKAVHFFQSVYFSLYAIGSAQSVPQAFHRAALLPAGPEPKPALVLSGSSPPNQPDLRAWCVMPTQAPQSWMQPTGALQVPGGKARLWHLPFSQPCRESAPTQTKSEFHFMKWERAALPAERSCCSEGRAYPAKAGSMQSLQGLLGLLCSAHCASSLKEPGTV